MFVLSKHVNNSFPGFTHHDISVHWWTAYHVHAFLDNERRSIISNVLECLSMNDIEGPKVFIQHQDEEIHVCQDTRNIYERITNYTTEQLNEVI